MYDERENKLWWKLGCIMNKVAIGDTFFTYSCGFNDSHCIEEHQPHSRGDGFYHYRIVRKYNWEDAMDKLKDMIDKCRTNIDEVEEWMEHPEEVDHE